MIELFLGTFKYIQTRDRQYYGSFRFALLIVIGTIPAVVIGGLFADFIGGELTAIHYVAISLIITGGALWLIRNLRGDKKEEELTITDTLVVGFAQTLALAPGISRSGATVVAALARKVNPEVALKFSFFLSIPVSIGSLVFKLSDISTALSTPGLAMPYVAAFIASVVVSIFAIKLFINLVTNGNLIYFAIYCFSVSILIFILA